MKYAVEKLGNYIEVLSGFAFKSKDFVDKGVPIIKIKNITPPNVSLCDLSYVSTEIAKQQQRYMLEYNDVLIALTGSHINQIASVVGRVARVKYFETTLLNQRVGKITVTDEDKCNIDYVYYFLSEEKIKYQLAGKAGGTANQANISPNDVKNLLIPFPPIETQRRIADILSAYDDLIENNQKQIKLLEEAAQRLYKEWFVDLHFPGYENTEIIDGVPEGWERKSIEDVCLKINAGGTPNRKNPAYYSSNDYQWFKTKELLDCWLIDSEEHISKEGLENSSAKLFPAHTVVMAIYASPTLGRLGVLSQEATTNQAALCLIANEKIISWQWLYQKLFELRVEFNAIASGAGQQNISSSTVKSKEIIVPDKKTIKRYTSLVTPIFDELLILTKAIKILSESRDRLLSKLMSGELEVERGV